MSWKNLAIYPWSEHDSSASPATGTGEVARARFETGAKISSRARQPYRQQRPANTRRSALFRMKQSALAARRQHEIAPSFGDGP